MALDAADSTCSTIADRKRTILSGVPIKLARTIELFDKKDLRPFVELIETAIEPPTSAFTVRLAWDKRGYCVSCCDPRHILRTLCAAVQRETRPWRMRQYCIGGTLHGDSHFANFMIDASVPEDPLVFSIDPAVPPLIDPSAPSFKRRCAELAETVGLRQPAEFSKVLEGMKQDLTWDIAKMMLSAACGYSLAYRRAFSLERRGSEFGLKRLPPEELKRLSDAGGISGSQIVQIDAPVDPDSLRNHGLATEVILEEYLRRYSEVVVQGDQESLSLAVVRLWLLAVRHGFSIVERLFPANVDRAMVMYLLMARFVNLGYGRILQILEDPSRKPDCMALFKLTEERLIAHK
jgi:hypothetical protein